MARDKTDGIDAVADELYGLHPGEFIAARDVWARQARHNGDRVLASRIAALRRPTTSAWMVNLLRRQAGDVIEQLVELGAELREAQDQLAAADLRRLAAERHRLVVALTGQARRLAAAAGQDVDRTVLTEVEATLGAALADPVHGAQVLSGRLVRPLEHVGFGPAPSPSSLAGSDDDTDAGTPASRGGLHSVGTSTASKRQAMKRQEERARAARARELARANEVVASARRALAHTQRRVEDATAHREDAHRVVSELRERLTDAQRRAAEADLDERASAAELTKAQRAVEEAERARAALDD